MKVLQNGWFAGGSLYGAATSAAGVRYRFNVYRTFDTCAVALRRLDSRFRTFDESVIETGGINGMVTLDQSLERLVGEGAITPRAALGLSRYPSQLKQRLGVI